MGTVVTRYLKAVSRSAEFVIQTTHGSSTAVASGPDEAGISELFRAGQPTIFPFWNAHSLLLLTAFLRRNQIQQIDKQFEAVADDSPGGLLTRHILQASDIVCRPLSFLSSEARLEDIRGILTERPHLFMAADSHGPYRSVSVGMARLVSAYDLTCPISACASRSLPLFRKIGMALPLPRSRIVLVSHKPFCPARTHGVRKTRDTLEVTLKELESDAGRLVNAN